MALEELLDAKKVEKKPYKLALYAALCVTLAIFLSYYIFPDYSSVVLISFTIIPIIPIIVKVFEIEEVKLEHFDPFKKSKSHKKQKFGVFTLFKKYNKLIRIYWFIFLAMVITFSFWYTFLPDDASSRIFKAQIDTLYEFDAANAVYSDRLLTKECDTNYLLEMQDTVTDCKVIDLNKDGYDEYIIYENSTKPTKVYYSKTQEFGSYRPYVRDTIFWNNFKLLVFILLTSFVLGAGALFTLTWNASIIGVFVGEFVNKVVSFFGNLPFIEAPAYFIALPLSLFSIAFHGFFEFMAYFFATFSGGMIGISMIRHKVFDRQFLIIMFESVVLLVASLALLMLGAVIESVI